MRRRQIPGEPEPPSKGMLKRAAHAVQDLADELIAAPETLLDSLDLPEKLRDAIDLARRITAHGGLARQRQYVGKLMRHADVEAIRAALEARDQQQKTEARRFQSIEDWRDRLLDGGAEALAAFGAEHPAADLAELGRLVAQAHAERSADRPPAAARELFKRVRDIALAP
ncbi:MAG: DUF615 domain-containing protein [Steroidobacteraceae bacterium]|nr:DUF615 domain-containing protein [Steroidobacteraceae bacterium]MCC7200035.1 DUF615 domain-containing protein [Gammaproteobacteria bacterium]